MYAGGNLKFPGLLAKELRETFKREAVTNERGTAYQRNPMVGRLCGLMLEAIDPGARVQSGCGLPRDVASVFGLWRGLARAHAGQLAAPLDGDGLRVFLEDWQRRRPGRGSNLDAWPREAPLIHLMYQLVHWLPEFQHDPAALPLLEMIGRAIIETAQTDAFRAAIVFDPDLERRSIESALWNVFRPIAEREISPTETEGGRLPLTTFNLLSIHQSKGLEFPMVIVDIGSEFGDGGEWSRFLRFPEAGSRAHRLEDEFRRFSALGKPSRDPVDRAFDDLIRKFFVAFSRAQDVLLLVGIGDATSGPRRIPNVAAGWTRDGVDHWNDSPGITLI